LNWHLNIKTKASELSQIAEMTEELLQKLLKQYRVPTHIQKHMKKVAAVALFLGQKITQSGEEVDLIALRQAALLHDILKIGDFKTLDFDNFEQDVTAEDIQFWTALMKAAGRTNHENAAYNMLKEIAEEKIATIIRKHRFAGLIEAHDKPVTWEEKLLYYADKRILHDKIVSTSQRLKDGKERYFPDGNHPPDHHLVEKALYRLEQEICTAAGITPEQITEESVKMFLEKL
jgi:HD superfamily phosphodiesterase